MDLPRDVVEHILYFLCEDKRTLKVVSLTCRALFSAARRLIHRKIELATWKVYSPSKLADRVAVKVLPARKVREAHMQYLSVAGGRGLLGYTRELIIAIGPSFSPETLETCLHQFRSFEQVQILRIHQFDLASFLPHFERYFTQFVPTLRSLHLPDVVGSDREVLEFICKFPRLDDLSLKLSSACSTDDPPRPSMEPSPPLRGKLILRGWGFPPSRFLLEIPGGLHFRSIDVGKVGKANLDEVLVACSSTLEEFSFSPTSSELTHTISCC
ncbi:hypothetical protein BJ322DRAFT_1063581 [Thelephora terrestris]|uniref:F-box domain-containing protein n=1 Tax=Thelephora terrestris TaxID=56493 RepID=A0A9P6L6K2_9AGAM|nr:hypothetical protein BJ322DRAFT_1063581 [Thelephora terrestris]